MNNHRNALYFIALAVSLAFVWFTGPACPSWAQGPGLGLEVSPEALTPTQLSYQGRITNPSTGDPISGTYTIIFRIYDAAAGGNKLWEEGKDVQVSAGLFSTPLGDTTPMDPAMFNGQSLWLALKVGADAEAAPRQQLLPVAYALSLAPGATVSTTSSGPALIVHNAGSGDALRVEGRAYVTGDLAVGGNLVGGAHDHDVRYINTTGPDAMSGSSAGPLLTVAQSGTSAGNSGVRGDTASIANESAGVLGVAGWTNTALNNYAGVLGKSTNGLAVAGVSDNGYGVYGQSGINYGVYGIAGGSPAAVYGNNTGTGPGIYAYKGSGTTGAALQAYSYGSGNGVQAYSSGGWSAYVYGGGSGALYAGGNSTVAGTLTTQRVAYSSPRTHYWSVGGEGFQPTNSGASYNNYGGMGGACVSTGSNLVAPVHLPHGATVTSLTGKYYVNGGPVVYVYLYRLTMTGAYAGMATVSSSGLSGYGSASSSSIGYATIDNTNYGYFINAWWGTGDCNTKVMGAVLSYTVSEAE